MPLRSAETLLRALLSAERTRRAGVDRGWETHRTLLTRLAFRPVIVPWLRHDLDWTTAFRSDRSANLLARAVSGTDTTLALARSAGGQRDWGLTFSFDPALLVRTDLGPSAQGGTSTLASVVSAVRPLTARYQTGVSSRFNRDPVDPGPGV